MSTDGRQTRLPEFERLLTAARRGSGEALGAILKRYQRVLLHAARRELPADLQAKGGASDLVQESFLEAQRDFPRFAGTTEGELLAWLRCLLRNNVANFFRAYRRREKRQVSREEPLWTDSWRTSAAERHLVVSVPGPGSDAMLRESTARCRRAVEQLAAPQREVIRLRFESRLSYTEIGSRLGLSKEAVRKLLARALRHLEYQLRSA